MSTTVVNPRLDSISRRNRFNGTAPPRPAERQWGSVKCTWEFQNPAVTVDRIAGEDGYPGRDRETRSYGRDHPVPHHHVGGDRG